MALVKMEKVLLLGHKSEKEDFLNALQGASIIDLSRLDEEELRKHVPDLAPGEGLAEKELESLVNDLSASANYLSTYSKPPSLMEGILPTKLEFTRKESDEIVESYDASTVILRCKEIQKERDELNTRENSLKARTDLLAGWTDLDADVADLKDTEDAVIRAVTVESRILPEQLEAEFRASPMDIAVVKGDGRQLNCIIAYPREDEAASREFLEGYEVETVDFSALKGTPKEILDESERELLDTSRRKQELAEESRKLEGERRKLLLLYDHYQAVLESRHAESLSLNTKNAFALTGWIRKNDRNRLERIASELESITVTDVEPAQGEEPPIELANTRAWRPFETVTELYAVPRYFELDPTPLLAVWFAIFFALCLTDAGYGLILALVALVMMRKVQGDKRTLWLLFIAGATTVVIGALTGSWFGDLADYTNVPALVKFRHAIELFDPIKSPIVFFRLALGAGVAHVFFGLGIRVYQDIRNRAYLDAFADQFLWMVWWAGIIIVLFSTDQVVKLALSNRVLLPSFMTKPGMVATGAASLLILLLAGRKEEGIMMKGLLGVMRLTVLGGVFSFLGDFLSYLRLMALGMTTGGIAMAINAICLKALPIPKVVGILVWIPMTLMLGVFINTLGGYVHTLRLQYVEFFQKFYTGGGKPFKPFAKQFKHTLVTDTEPQTGGD
jgi:V/A-type H+-transporting ATPase subunit I